MKIDRIQISVAELCRGYEERGTDGIEGIVAYGGLLDATSISGIDTRSGFKKRSKIRL